jgi:cell division protein FtsL
LGFASIALALIAGFFSGEQFTLPTTSKYLFYGALLAYIFVVILSIMSYRTKEWSFRPEPETLVSHCTDKECSVGEIRNWLVNEIKESYTKNLV